MYLVPKQKMDIILLRMYNLELRCQPQSSQRTQRGIYGYGKSISVTSVAENYKKQTRIGMHDRI